MLDPFLVLNIPFIETSLAALVSFIMCSSHVSSPPVGHGVSGLVLAQVTTLGMAPVFLRAKTTTFWQGQSHCSAENACHEKLHVDRPELSSRVMPWLL